MPRCTVCRQKFEAVRSDAAICSNRCHQKKFRESRKPEYRGLQLATPASFFAVLDREFRFDLDACATPENAKCARFFTREDDALTQEWRGRVFMNPPFGRQIERWVRKAYESAKAGALVVCLVPASTDSEWWHTWVTQAAEVRFLRGRLRFTPAKHNASFPCAVVIFKPGRRAARQRVGVIEARV